MFTKQLSIKRKIWLTITLVSFLMIVLGVTLTYFLYERLYVDKQIDLLEKQGAMLKKEYVSDSKGKAYEQLSAWVQESLNINVVVTEDPMQLSAGIPFHGVFDENLITFEERQQLLEGSDVLMIRDHPRFDQKVLALALPIFEKDVLQGVIFLYMSVDVVYEPFKPVQTILFITLSFIFVVLIWLANRITISIISPLKEMEKVSEQMAKGDLTKRITINHKDEIGKLATSLNEMAQSLEIVEAQRSEFLQNVSHELRTPLSYIKGYTEAIQEGVVQGEQVEQYLGIIQKETERLRRLVHDLLDLAQLEGNSYPMKEEPIAYSQLIEEVSQRFTLRSQQKGINIRLDLDEDIIIKGDSDRLEQVISNLLDNAIRYTSTNESVELILTSNKSYAFLEVKDKGPGIPSNELQRIFERFYRVEKSRTRKEGGTGLGLSIAQHIVQKHGGKLEVASDEQLGTTFTIILPVITE